jgi:hypothetical protein
LFHLLRLGFVLLQAHEASFPLRQFGVGQRDVLDDGIALVFVLRTRKHAILISQHSGTGAAPG